MGNKKVFVISSKEEFFNKINNFTKEDYLINSKIFNNDLSEFVKIDGCTNPTIDDLDDKLEHGISDIKWLKHYFYTKEFQIFIFEDSKNGKYYKGHIDRMLYNIEKQGINFTDHMFIIYLHKTVEGEGKLKDVNKLGGIVGIDDFNDQSILENEVYIKNKGKIEIRFFSHGKDGGPAFDVIKKLGESNIDINKICKEFISAVDIDFAKRTKVANIDKLMAEILGKEDIYLEINESNQVANNIAQSEE